jgi:hypothetical protein
VAYKASVFRLQIRDDRQYSMTNANISHFDYAAQKYGTQLRAKSFWENPTPTKRKVVPVGASPVILDNDSSSITVDFS